MGETRLEKCPNWRGAMREQAVAPTKTDDDTLLPWSGAALGTTGLPFLTARGEPKLIALAGSHNAGKTTLLGSWYQLIGRSGRIDEADFAGSYTLEGWEAVAHALRWDGGTPRFPAHTSSGAGRSPGLLHLSLRPEGGRLADFLFADAPGEWFQRWAVEEQAGDAEGARWLAERASAFVVVADGEALSGPSRGQARVDLVQLIRRIGSIIGARPAALAWTKADVAVPTAIRDTIVEEVGRSLPETVQFRTSVSDFEVDGSPRQAAPALLDLLSWCVRMPPPGFEPPRAAPTGTDPFFLVGVGR